MSRRGTPYCTRPKEGVPEEARLIRTLRLQWGLTQRRLAERAGVDVATVCALERGLRRVGKKTLAKLTRVFL